MESGCLDTKSNIQFGEGGAGTFSDGKLNTGIKSKYIRLVLETFHKNGADKNILYDARAHIGTDVLSTVIVNMREYFKSLGGRVLFETKFIDFEEKGGVLTGAVLENNGKVWTEPCDKVVLAIGHSSRDTIRKLRDRSIAFKKKPFSLGYRIEHLQADINTAQYGSSALAKQLPPADYHLVEHVGDRVVYSFCMCPGGTVVAASSEEGGMVVNGMSEYARDKENANCALLVGIEPPFDSDHPLAGMYLQREIERKAFKEGGSDYTAPAQLLGDFLKNEPTKKFGFVNPSCPTGVAPSDLRRILPHKVTETIAGAINDFDKKLNGFNLYDAVLTAPESRSSSPIRILRNEFYQTTKVQGIFPSGEGAGYAGGIVSAAVDGIKCAEAIISDLR